MVQSVHIIGSRIGGGAERFYARLVNSLAEHSQVLAINPMGSPVSQLVDSGVPQTHIGMKSNYDLLSGFRMRKTSMQMAPAIVQSYMGRATRLTRIPRGKGVVHVARLGGYYNVKAYRHAHHLIGNTRGICDYLIKEGVPANQVHHISNFVEPMIPPSMPEMEKLRTTLGISADTFVIACAARFHENKGLPELLSAFALLRKVSSDVRLIVVGAGPTEQQIQRQIEELELKDHVILPGWCDPRPYYYLADVLTNSSRHEPLGNTILEAWACGKPLVATRTQGALELVTDGENGLITPLHDSQALFHGFLQLMENYALRRSLAECGLQTVQSRYGKEYITSQYLSLYKQLLAAEQQ